MPGTGVNYTLWHGSLQSSFQHLWHQGLHMTVACEIYAPIAATEASALQREDPIFSTRCIQHVGMPVGGATFWHARCT